MVPPKVLWSCLVLVVTVHVGTFTVGGAPVVLLPRPLCQPLLDEAARGQSSLFCSPLVGAVRISSPSSFFCLPHVGAVQNSSPSSSFCSLLVGATSQPLDYQ